jgi:hypothetical protein
MLRTRRNTEPLGLDMSGQSHMFCFDQFGRDLGSKRMTLELGLNISQIILDYLTDTLLLNWLAATDLHCVAPYQRSF